MNLEQLSFPILLKKKLYDKIKQYRGESIPPQPKVQASSYQNMNLNQHGYSNPINQQYSMSASQQRGVVAQRTDVPPIQNQKDDKLYLILNNLGKAVLGSDTLMHVLDMMKAVIDTVLHSPNVERYRSIHSTHPNFATTIWRYYDSIDFFVELGWTKQPDGQSLVLYNLNNNRLLQGIQSIDFFRGKYSRYVC